MTAKIVKGLRFLYLPNEEKPGDQIGPRKAFETLAQEGVLSAYEVFSYLWEDTQSGNHADTLLKLLKVAEAFQPDVIFWQHLGDSFPVDRLFFQHLKQLSSRPKLVYHEGDPFDRIIKRTPDIMQTIIPETDMVFLVGLGYLASIVKKYGAKSIIYAPHSYDAIRSGQSWVPTKERLYDISMIANLTHLRVAPWVYLPGGRKRKQLAVAMSKVFGDRFAVFGTGWEGFSFSKGPIPFNQQERINRSSWITINWGQFDKIPFYFSDRLPISLAAGVPHITNYQPGYEHLFRHCDGLYAVHSVDEAIEVARYLLSLPRDELGRIGLAGARFAAEHLEATKVYREVVTVIRERLFKQD